MSVARPVDSSVAKEPHFSHPSRFGAVLLALGLATCGSPADEVNRLSETGFDFATYQFDCAPWDGPAMTLGLAKTPAETPLAGSSYPHIQVSIWNQPATFPGATVDWSAEDENLGVARRCTAEGICEQPTSVRVHFTSLLDDRTLNGDLKLVFEGGDEIAGPFSATWVPFQALCG